MTIEFRDLALHYYKCEDPAKITYSILDFVSCNATKNQEFFQDLERFDEHQCGVERGDCKKACSMPVESSNASLAACRATNGETETHTDDSVGLGLDVHPGGSVETDAI